MHQSRRLFWPVAAAIATFPFQGISPSMAAVTFGQTAVKQDKFIAIAVPRAAGYYNLLLLEQISDKKQCWRESGSKPVRVEPLLLNFNFTGICGRATDSNGYSIRIAGKDKALDYRLSLQKREDNLVLVGFPRQGKPIQVGQTQGIRSGFLKINLDSGWKFAKRTYKGKTLGHIYLSRDTAPPLFIADAKQSDAAPAKSTTASTPAKADPPIAKSATAKSKSAKASDKSADKESASATTYRVMVVKPNAVQISKLRNQQPGAYRTSYDGKSVMQVGLFNSRSKAESMKKELTGQGFKVLMVSDERRISSQPSPTSAGPLLASVTSGASSWGRLVTVPAAAPIGDAKGSKQVYARNTQLPPPPPPPKALLTRRYRVLVIVKSDAQQDKIRDLVASAFRTTYQGKSAMQVGSFSSSAEAESKAELMRQNGFKPITEVL